MKIGTCHFVETEDDGIIFGYENNEGEKYNAFRSTSLPVLPSEEELKAIGILLYGGAGWQEINIILLSLAGQKTGENFAGSYRAEKCAEIARNWGYSQPSGMNCGPSL